MDIFFSWIAIALGLIVGSFFNVLIYRLPLDLSIVFPGSACPNCGHKLKPWENIPVLSYLFLRGKCSSCKAPLSLQYPLIELLTGIATLTLWVFMIRPRLEALADPWQIGILFFQGATLLMLIPLSIIDIKHYIIPDVFTLPGIALAFSVAFFPGGLTPVQSLLGMAVGGGPLFLLGYVSKFLLKKEETLGIGDVWLMIFIGGLWGWQIAFAALIIASFLGSFVGIGLLAFRVLAQDHKLPFGPFLACGIWVAVLFFNKLLALYLAWLGS
jgi:leader peptidase (prepilin peptidase)/N-methyltransferase